MAGEAMSELSQGEQYLIDQIRAGSAEGWSQLVERFEGRLIAFATSRSIKRADAEDLVQETFVKFLGGLPTYREEASLETYLFMILRRRIIDFLRGVARGEAALSGAVARRLLEQVREGGGRSSGVPDSIAARLSARELEVLLLLDDHLATDEIAKRLFISEHTVRSHVKSLLRKLGVSSRREALEALSTARR